MGFQGVKNETPEISDYSLYIFVGDYVMYKDIAEYKILISNLCVSRIKGEESILYMNNHGSVKMYLKYLKVDEKEFSNSINNTITEVNDIKTNIQQRSCIS